MLIEKSKTEKDLIEKINKVIRKKYTKEERILLEKIIYYIFSSKLRKKELEKIIEKLQGRKENSDMVAEEILKKSWNREYKRGKIEGKEEGRILGIQEGKLLGKKSGIEIGEENAKKQLIIKMIKNNIDEDLIIKISGITKKKMKEIKEKYIK